MVKNHFATLCSENKAHICNLVSLCCGPFYVWASQPSDLPPFPALSTCGQDPRHLGDVPAAFGLQALHLQVSVDASGPGPTYKHTLTLIKQVSTQNISGLHVVTITLYGLFLCVTILCRLTLSPTERIFHPLLLFLQLSSSFPLSLYPNPSFYHSCLGTPSQHCGIRLVIAGKLVLNVIHCIIQLHKN